MSCNCSSSCNCDSGVELINSQAGAAAPIITNVVVNGDNTITFTFSDSSTINTGAITVNDPSALTYVLAHFTDGTATFDVPANSLEDDGDKLRITARGTVPGNTGGTKSTSLIFGGNGMAGYTNGTSTLSISYLYNLDIIKDGTDAYITGSIKIFDDSTAIFGNPRNYDIIYEAVIDSLQGGTLAFDYTTDLTLELTTADGVDVDLFSIELIKNN